MEILSAAWRAVFAFALALFATWILNKQFIARMTYYDFILGVIIGSVVGHIPNDFREPFLPVVTPLVVITGLGVLTGWLAMRYENVRHVLQGEPTVVIQNGKVLDTNMRRLRYNLDQLNSALRTRGIFDISHVEFAVLEPGGQLSVLPKSQHRPVSPADLKLSTTYEGMAVELIMDGQVIHKNLSDHSLSEDWLFQELERRGIYAVASVFYAVLNSKGEVMLDLYQDELNRPMDVEGRHPSTPPSPAVP